MSWLEPVTLKGQYVHLVPLLHDHQQDLMVACQDGELWKLWYTTVPEPSEMADNIDEKLTLQAQGLMLPFAVIEPNNHTVVGVTTYMNIEAKSRRLEIGSTWYRQSVQRTGLNTEAKLLLLQHAFEDKGCIAVEFRTHFLNQQSRRGIERLGAKLDGVLRNHSFAKDGSLRDTDRKSVV